MTRRPTVKYLKNVPTADDTFIVRILKTMNIEATELAELLQVPYADIEAMMLPRHQLVEIDRSEIWWRIGEMLDVRIGLLMAARHELQKALQQDRAQRALRTERALRRDKRSPPRS